MFRINAAIAVMISGMTALALPPTAHADDPVVYEVWSSTIASANIEWTDTAGQHSLENAPLPWRISVMVPNARAEETQLRATWQPGSTASPNPGRYMWVRLRIYSDGSQLCEHTADVGQSECSGRGYYADWKTPGHS